MRNVKSVRKEVMKKTGLTVEEVLAKAASGEEVMAEVLTLAKLVEGKMTGRVEA